MKPRNPSRCDSTKKKPVQSVKQPARGKVWVNPKSHFKNYCKNAWKRAEVPSPKFIEISQIDMRAKTPSERPMAKTAAAGKSGTSSKNARAAR